ncbi:MULTISPECIES: LacI family DNA-binding transcriptional regulator [unclassified Streptococcus]|uniref:LacI family DNA-binding transcriptional regulator n=1 Tax=unclassified Streptococcus TaxID=2608887 RepID=UPI001071DAF0|nr:MULTISPECIES: LacI family DNA-binding transcriptional regulator [unclassified Streptococcus]MBF0787838.1 LacI family DNA-binding transcriptional regulator [Streptococcus sp. 19428wC2_LYSM12]MCQ9211194.1 LacI family DNA-binding transcriptional regulator [Streptococcus sp. B01]MCQ9214469.1 LacI family DNA-binding transcriptional regulator [Streptococcus sp. O1]TFV05161.1 LacI family DNA-binding transcriptional regulator [Streptococcus sp. LYSM12]
MVTLKDIAQKTQLSTATVSRVLKEDASLSVSPDTREKVFTIAQELGYTKHLNKQQLDSSTRKIGILQWYTESRELDDLYYYSIRISLEQHAFALGYDIVRCFHDISSPLLKEVDALIAIGKFSQQQMTELAKQHKQLVFVDFDTLAEGFSCVTTDFNRSVIRVIDHYLEQGITEIGMIAGQEETYDKKMTLLDPRLRTFKQYLSDHHLYQKRFVFTGPFTSQAGYQLMKDAIDSLGEDLPTAFFIANDSLAVGALRALQEAQITVPNRVQLITFNDTPITKQVYPALSSITVFTEEMGIQAVDLVDAMLQKPTTYHPRMVKLGTQLTLRESSL